MKAWSPERRSAAALASLVFGATCPCVYLLERLFERLRSGAGNPGLVISEVHAAFYWRCILAVWFGGLIAALMMRTRPAAEARLVPPWVIPWLLCIGPVAIVWAVRFP
jgi:hypothetical protein